MTIELNYFAARFLQSALGKAIDELDARAKISLDRRNMSPDIEVYYDSQRRDIFEAIGQLTRVSTLVSETAWRCAMGDETKPGIAP